MARFSKISPENTGAEQNATDATACQHTIWCAMALAVATTEYSPRINTDGTSQVISRRDYHPFGEEIARTGYGSDTIRKQFTGYERDAETGLDFAQARYFSASLGRFASPDPVLTS